MNRRRPSDLLGGVLAWRMQAEVLGGLHASQLTLLTPSVTEGKLIMLLYVKTLKVTRSSDHSGASDASIQYSSPFGSVT